MDKVIRDNSEGDNAHYLPATKSAHLMLNLKKAIDIKMPNDVMIASRNHRSN